MRLTSNSQVTIPQALRERHGLLPETDVSFEAVAGEVLIRVAHAEQVRPGVRLQGGLPVQLQHIYLVAEDLLHPS